MINVKDILNKDLRTLKVEDYIDKDKIIGFPSGEIIELNEEQLKTLIKYYLVYVKLLFNGDFVYSFDDENIEDILKFLKNENSK